MELLTSDGKMMGPGFWAFCLFVFVFVCLFLLVLFLFLFLFIFFSRHYFSITLEPVLELALVD